MVMLAALILLLVCGREPKNEESVIYLRRFIIDDATHTHTGPPLSDLSDVYFRIIFRFRFEKFHQNKYNTTNTKELK